MGSMYLAGLSVEGMLRSLVWMRDRAFDERHDLRRLAVRVGDLGLLRADGRDDDFVGTVEVVNKLWHNSLRYADQRQALRWIRDRATGRTRVWTHPVGICRAFFAQSSEVVRRCEVLWDRHQRQS